MNTIEIAKTQCKQSDCDKLICTYEDYCEKEHDYDCNKFCSPLCEAYFLQDDSIMLDLNEIAYRGLIQAIKHFMHSEKSCQHDTECDLFKDMMSRSMFADLLQRIEKQEWKSKGSKMRTNMGSTLEYVPKEER